GGSFQPADKRRQADQKSLRAGARSLQGPARRRGSSRAEKREEAMSKVREAFARNADNPTVVGDLLEAILREHPEFKGRKVEYAREGDFAHVVIIGDDKTGRQVFKGPKSWEFVGAFGREPEIFAQLQGK